jgi:hypothetical protein
MSEVFHGRPVVPGECTAEAAVSHGGFNTLASFQMPLMFGDKKVKCGDQNNADLYKKPLAGKALCLPMTIGSTTGGMVLFTVCSNGLSTRPACCFPSISTLWRPPAPYWPPTGPTPACRWSTSWGTSSWSMCRTA